MFWSGCDAAGNKRLLREAGFVVLDAEVHTQWEDENEVRFLWVLCQRPAGELEAAPS